MWNGPAWGALGGGPHAHRASELVATLLGGVQQASGDGRIVHAQLGEHTRNLDAVL